MSFLILGELNRLGVGQLVPITIWLQIKNETDQPYQLHLYMTDEHLVGEWRTVYPQLYQYEVYEKRTLNSTCILGRLYTT